MTLAINATCVYIYACYAEYCSSECHSTSKIPSLICMEQVLELPVIKKLCRFSHFWSCWHLNVVGTDPADWFSHSVNGDVGAGLAHPSNQTCCMLVSSTANICKGQANLLKRSERAASVRTELKIVYKKSSQLHNSSFRQAVVTSEKKKPKIFK